MKSSADNQAGNSQRSNAAGKVPTDKTSPDGNINRGEQRAQGNASPGGQSSSEASRSSHGQHGGNHGNDQDNRNQQPASGQNAKGSSNRGSWISADQRNQGGGQDNEKRQSQSQPKGEGSDYANGKMARSSANDGGTIDDANNRDAK